MIKVSFVVLPGFTGNALFEGRRNDAGAHAPNAHWMDTFLALHKKALERGFIVATSDLIPVDDADVVVYTLQPNSPYDIVRQKQKTPKLKTILLLLETSLGGYYTFNPKNHQGYDAIITYDDRLVDNRRYFPMRSRAYFRERILKGPPFNQRRVGCLVGTNRKMCYRSGFMAMRKGWHFSPKDWLDYVFCPGELITYRSKVGQLCAQFASGTFDIFGEGWEIHKETWGRCQGVPEASTLSYIGNYRYYFAFENHESEYSLISERIWDALWADTVPVYRGNKHISRIVPRDCYVDATSFSSPKKMLEWLVHTPESEWKKIHEAGRAFINSKEIQAHLPDACAEELLRPIIEVAKRPPGQNRGTKVQYRDTSASTGSELNSPGLRQRCF